MGFSLKLDRYVVIHNRFGFPPYHCFLKDSSFVLPSLFFPVQHIYDVEKIYTYICGFPLKSNRSKISDLFGKNQLPDNRFITTKLWFSPASILVSYHLWLSPTWPSFWAMQFFLFTPNFWRKYSHLLAYMIFYNVISYNVKIFSVTWGLL